MRWIQRRGLQFLQTHHVDLRERGLDLGVRILLVSDVHARDDWFPRPNVARLVDEINAVDGVDLVALTGDFVGNDVTAAEWSAEEYARIEAPAAAVLGNHDHWTDAARVQRALEDVGGIEVLTNRALPLRDAAGGRGKQGAWIAGIDSCWTWRNSTGPGADPEAAFADVPAGADVVVLGHEPHLATMHEHTLHLACHTHLGQVRTPLFGDWTARMHMPRYSEPYPCRLYEVPVAADGSKLPPNHRTTRDRRWIYTTGGVGFSTVSLRAFCPPELVVLDV